MKYDERLQDLEGLQMAAGSIFRSAKVEPRKF